MNPRRSPDADGVRAEVEGAGSGIDVSSVPYSADDREAASSSRSRTFAGESVEVDAIPTSVLRQIVETAIERHIDAALAVAQLAEDQKRQGLLAMPAGVVAS